MLRKLRASSLRREPIKKSGRPLFFEINYKLSVESAVPQSTIKNIVYGKSQNPGIVTLKMLCDGFGITITEFFDTDEFRNLEQEIE